MVKERTDNHTHALCMLCSLLAVYVYDEAFEKIYDSMTAKRDIAS